MPGHPHPLSTAVRCPALRVHPLVTASCDSPVSPTFSTDPQPVENPVGRSVWPIWGATSPGRSTGRAAMAPNPTDLRTPTGRILWRRVELQGHPADTDPSSTPHPCACTAPSTARPQTACPRDPRNAAADEVIEAVVPRIHRTYDNDESSPSRLLPPRMADGRSVDLGLGSRGGSPAAWSGRACQPVGDATLSAHARDRRAGNG